MMTSSPSLRFRGSPRYSRGVAAVEFAITAPLLIFVMLAAAEVGRAFVYYDTLSYSIRNSARYVSENVIDGDTGVVSNTLVAGVQTAARNLAVYGSVASSGVPILPDGELMTVNVSTAGKYNIRVDATYHYQPMLGEVLPTFGFGSGPIPLAFDMQIGVTMRAIS